MKLNLKKLKLNQVILIVSILVIVAWLVMRSRRRENMDGTSLTSTELVLYIENTEKPNPFIAYGMAKKLTTDKTNLEKILSLATEGNTIELLELAKTL